MHSVERTVGIGKRASELMRAYSQSAAPRSYELWYTYVTGLKPELNQAVKSLIAQKQTLGVAEIDKLYDQYLAREALERRASQTSGAMLVELQKMIDVIEIALGSTRDYGEELESANRGLRLSPDGSKLHDIVETLIGATKAVAASNQQLNASLHASRDEVEDLRRLLDEVRSEAMTDALTGIANRKHFETMLTSQVARALLEKTPLVLVVIDIDHFKRFNDNFGHLTGDQVLRLVASAMRESMSADAFLARFGGEEFAMILPGADEDEAFACAEAIRKNVMCRELLKKSSGESLGRVTVSLGIAQLRASDTVASLLERADLCLYRAKAAGRNRTVSDRDPQYPSLSSAA